MKLPEVQKQPDFIVRHTDQKIFRIGDQVELTHDFYTLDAGARFEITDIEPSLPTTIKACPGTVWFLRGKVSINDPDGWRGAPELFLRHAPIMQEPEFSLDEVHNAIEIIGG